MKIAPQHQQVMPYLIVPNAAGLIEFLKKVFNGEELERHMRTETLIAHAEVKIGGSTLMIADATDEYKAMVAGMFIYVDDTDKTYNLALECGAESVLEPYNPPYCDRAAGVRDASGCTWWLATLK